MSCRKHEKRFWTVDYVNDCLACQLEVTEEQLIASRAEVERLKAGRFTEAEFRNLCHGFDACDRERFAHGCIAYQRKLFGDVP